MTWKTSAWRRLDAWIATRHPRLRVARLHDVILGSLFGLLVCVVLGTSLRPTFDQTIYEVLGHEEADKALSRALVLFMLERCAQKAEECVEGVDASADRLRAYAAQEGKSALAMYEQAKETRDSAIRYLLGVAALTALAAFSWSVFPLRQRWSTYRRGLSGVGDFPLHLGCIALVITPFTAFWAILFPAWPGPIPPISVVLICAFAISCGVVVTLQRSLGSTASLLGAYGMYACAGGLLMLYAWLDGKQHPAGLWLGLVLALALALAAAFGAYALFGRRQLQGMNIIGVLTLTSVPWLPVMAKISRDGLELSTAGLTVVGLQCLVATFIVMCLVQPLLNRIHARPM